jgi:hypothetical protein
MCTVLLSPGVNPIAVNKYINFNINIYHTLSGVVGFLAAGASDHRNGELHKCYNYLRNFLWCSSIIQNLFGIENRLFYFNTQFSAKFAAPWTPLKAAKPLANHPPPLPLATTLVTKFRELILHPKRRVY